MSDNPLLKNPFKVSKLDAGRRQLRTAIRMWFYDQDPIAIHTLTLASYEILHSVSKARGRTSPLLLDAAFVTADLKGAWIALVRGYANFKIAAH